MKNITARFTSGTGATLIVLARTGKKDIRVAVQMRAPGARTVTGCRNVFASDREAQATAKFEELRADAVKQGWTAKPAAERNAFSSVPAAPKAAAKK